MSRCCRELSGVVGKGLDPGEVQAVLQRKSILSSEFSKELNRSVAYVSFQLVRGFLCVQKFSTAMLI
jgi:hypothetical protein